MSRWAYLRGIPPLGIRHAVGPGDRSRDTRVCAEHDLLRLLLFPRIEPDQG